MRAAFAFLTPLGRATAPDPSTFQWFPLVGIVIGLAVGGAWWGANEVWTPGVAAAIAVAVDLGLTGLLHIDGLADSADGLLPPLERDRRLAVMRTPEVGAFALAVVASVLLLRFTALAAVEPDALVIAAVWCTSRVAMAAIATALPYAREEGLASAFLGANARWAVLFVALFAASIIDVAAVTGTVAGAGAVALLAHRRIGGFTGDVLGAAGVVGETIGLLVLAAR